MLQIASFGAPLFEVFARFIVWLYMPAILSFLIAFRFLKDGFLIVCLRRDLHCSARFRLALSSVFNASQGFAAGIAITLAIYYRKELFQCVSSLF
ncbi:hypothetical protein RCH14_004734 [Massilia sp. MP_M2]|uniref:hypothetical protein n=1 Tax=Massilia sp. MP_M2 TaxID=3071713 RepID=UPI00319E0619